MQKIILSAVLRGNADFSERVCRLAFALICYIFLVFSMSGCGEYGSSFDDQVFDYGLYVFASDGEPVECASSLKAAILSFDDGDRFYMNLADEALVKLQFNSILPPFPEVEMGVRASNHVCFDHFSWRATLRLGVKGTENKFDAYVIDAVPCKSEKLPMPLGYVILPSGHIVAPVVGSMDFLMSQCRIDLQLEVLQVE